MRTRVTLSSRQLSALAAAASVGLLSLRAWGAGNVNTVVGPDGAAGANGTYNLLTHTATPGQPGDVGGAANAAFLGPGPVSPPGELVYNDAYATGGTGGNGGLGASVRGTSGPVLVSSGGDGGGGGVAYANVELTNHPESGPASVLAQAIGGNGGTGGDGGGGAARGAGGNGGRASVGNLYDVLVYDAGDHDQFDDLHLSLVVPSSFANAIARGGNAGAGGTADGAGGNGGGVTITTVKAVAASNGLSSATGSARAEADGYGGNGGAGSGLGAGGNGADVTLSNNVVGESGKRLELIQQAYGGDGGSGNVGGLAGNATSNLTITSGSPVLAFGNAPLLLTSSAVGGRGGASQTATGIAGGAANALADVTYDAQAFPGAIANATGGRGGDISGQTGSAGLGGSATATAHTNDMSFVSNNGAVATSDAEAYSTGGQGGSIIGAAGGNAGAGGTASSAAALQAIHASTGLASGFFGLFSTPNVVANGTGGDGGDVAGSGGGNAGAGGNATATVSATARDGLIYASITSRGGNGGSVTGAANGNGGAGGMATAGSANFNPNGADVLGIFEVDGGSGGAGSGAGFSGGHGGAPVFTPLSLSIDGKVDLTLTLTGGSGGAGTGGAAGGNGADASINNPLNVSATGTLTIEQDARGGNSGGSDGGSPGVSGNATSVINQTFNGQSSLQVTVGASAGGGGRVQNTNGSAGGNALASLKLTSDSSVVAGVDANGGSGGGVGGLSGFTAGAGGSGNANAQVTGTGVGPVTVTATAGSLVFLASNGGSIDSTMVGNGGAGGANTATAIATGHAAVTSAATATGGAGGQGSGVGFSAGKGGDATASATGVSTSGFVPTAVVTATATATGGAGGIAVNNASPAVRGAASATASATAVTLAIANATATGASGSVRATARDNSIFVGPISYVQGTAVAPTDNSGNSKTLSMAAWNAQSTPDLNAVGAYRSATNVDAIPRADDVTAVWAPDPNVRNALGNQTANVNAIGVIGLKGGAAGSPNTQSAVVELNENYNQLTSGGLIVGMLGTALPGGGLAPGDSLRFRIQRNGASLIDQTFTSNPTLLSYFQNNVLNLGPQNASTGGANLDLQFLFDFTGNLNAGTGAGIEFLVGTASAPQAGWANTSGGSWGTAGNWSGNVPNAPGAGAAFGATAAAKTITLDQNITIGTLTLDSASASYIIASGTGGSALILDNAGAQPAITVSAGSHEIAAPVQLGSGTNLTIGPGAALKFSGRLTGALDSLNISGGPDAWSAKLDLTNNDLILHDGGAAGLATIANQLKQGFNGGDWNGTGGITSSSAAGSTLRKMALGYGTMTGTFDGQAVSSSDVIVKYTVVGDANLDGSVNFSDLLALAQNYGKPGTPWSGGDFDYDGATNFNDLLSLAQNYGASVSGGFSAAFAWAAVPEPGMLGLLSGGFGLLCRRRRRASGCGYLNNPSASATLSITSGPPPWDELQLKCWRSTRRMGTAGGLLQAAGALLRRSCVPPHPSSETTLTVSGQR